jgi:hypothetical protein
MKKVCAIVALVLAILVGGSIPANASAAQASAPAAAVVSVAPVASVDLPTVFPRITAGWRGLTFHYDRTATKMIASGAATMGGFALGGAVAALVGLGMAQVYAEDAVEQGRCLKVFAPWDMGSDLSKARPGLESC